MRTVADTG